MSRKNKLDKAILKRQLRRDEIQGTLRTLAMFRRDGLHPPKGTVKHLEALDSILENEIALLKHEINILYLGGKRG